jgi:hypothetical protein
VRQGDSLSAVLFNLVLHKAIKHMEVKGAIVHKSKQVSGYADDIALIGRNLTALKELYRELQEEGLNVGLSINENKTKYMKMSPTQIN